jgi:hypothetical protein
LYAELTRLGLKYEIEEDDDDDWGDLPEAAIEGSHEYVMSKIEKNIRAHKNYAHKF